MKPRNILISGVITLVLGIGGYWVTTSKKRHANRIITVIEAYHDTHGKLPPLTDSSLLEALDLHNKNTTHHHYQPQPNGLFTLTITEGFDPPYWTYHSSSKTWKKE